MPQIKPAQQFFGIHRALNWHPDVRKFAEKRPGVFRGKEEFQILIHAAYNPHRFTYHFDGDFIKSFGRIYARQPDDVLDFMSLVRKILAKWQKTQAGIVIEFLYTHTTTPIDCRKVEYDKHGNCVAVVVEYKLKEGSRRFPVSHLTPGEIQVFRHPKLVAVSSLSDGELASLLNVPKDSVKKARQEVIRIDKHIEFWENPAVVHHMKTGEITPALEQLWAARRKGKK